jgi:hypothetical protein
MNPTNANDEHDRLAETAVEESDVLGYLAGLIRRACEDEVRRQERASLGQRRIDLGAKLPDLRSGAHRDRKRDGSRRPKHSGTIFPRVRVEKTRRLVFAPNIEEVPQPNRRPGRGRGHEHVLEIAHRRELPARLDRDIAARHIDDPPRQVHVVRADGLSHALGTHAGVGESLLGIVEGDLFGLKASASDLRHDIDPLEAMFEKLGKFVELLERIARSRDASER